ncbi:hypothetical protein C1H46_039220 [Malus baccata]|uniref:Uncharacterized protein n=1 Tax=Malus baccata TaxID=106549 RepID=A0A540KM32_MALBA|nr:hypothetical protein C1H46_039220 [Malus baccata]
MAVHDMSLPTSRCGCKPPNSDADADSNFRCQFQYEISPVQVQDSNASANSNFGTNKQKTIFKTIFFLCPCGPKPQTSHTFFLFL